MRTLDPDLAEVRVWRKGSVQNAGVRQDKLIWSSRWESGPGKG
jgi:hypothetical protein